MTRSERIAPDTARRPATTVTIEPVILARHRFILAVNDPQNRPTPFGADPSPDAMEFRACQVEAIGIAMRDYLLALAEDCAAHMSLPADPRSTIIAHMDDMMGDFRGALNVAVEDARDEAGTLRRIG
jgi:hypothetical protein